MKNIREHTLIKGHDFHLEVVAFFIYYFALKQGEINVPIYQDTKV